MVAPAGSRRRQDTGRAPRPAADIDQGPGRPRRHQPLDRRLDPPPVELGVDAEGPDPPLGHPSSDLPRMVVVRQGAPYTETPLVTLSRLVAFLSTNWVAASSVRPKMAA